MVHRFFLAAVLGVIATTSTAQDASGTWATEKTPDGYLEIQIAPCGGNLCGTITKAYDGAGVSGPYDHLGRQMIWDMAPSGTGQWENGKIWDPRNDRVYNSKMEISGGTLQVSGCFLGFCQAQTWTQVN